MSPSFGETIRQLRNDRGLTQGDLAEQMFVTRSTVARWEADNRMPDAVMIARLAKCLGTSAEALLNQLTGTEETQNIIMVDDEGIILSGGLPVLDKVFPGAIISGFTRPSEAVSYARTNPVSLAFLDIEMGKTSGIDLCRELQQINPQTRVIFLTAYPDYSLDAWKTGATGFILKPITAEEVRNQISKFRPLGGVEDHDQR